MRLYLRLAWRNIWRHRRRTIIVVLAIGLTLALMIFYDGLIAGFEQAIYGNAIQVLGGNIQVHAIGYSEAIGKTPLLPLENDAEVVEIVMQQPQVVAATRRINTGGMVTSREGALGVSITGIEPEKEYPVSLIAQNVADGRFLTSDDQDVAFIGKGMADAMGLVVGDRFTLSGQSVHDEMRNRTMTVVGIYDVGIPDIEKQSVYISLSEAQSLYGLSGPTEIVITLQQIGQEKAVMAAIAPDMTGYEVDTWENNFPELRNAVQTKGAAMNVFGAIMLLISGIGILNLLLMAVFERTREIGLLGALGMKPGQITILFLLEGAMMGSLGVAFGVGAGLLINIALMQVGIDYSQFSSLTEYTALISTRIYPSFGMEKVLQRTLTALIICLLASFYPAREAARHEPAESLHYV